jgi:Tol biopolymer transport system component
MVRPQHRSLGGTGAFEPRMRRLTLAMTAMLLLVPAAADASFPGSNGRIAFNWTFGCDGSMVATMKPDGSDRRLLTADACTEDGPPRAAYPDWSADGTRIAYFSDGRLSTMAADGSGQAPLPLDPATAARPSLSPDGKRIAYTRISGGRQWVYVANLDGTDERRLRAGNSPRWSPSGLTIAYLTQRSRLVEITARTNSVIRRHEIHARFFDWSPGGGRFVYASRGGNLWTVRVKPGGTPRRLLESTAIELSVAWSPDKRRIAFVRALPTGEERVRYGIYTMPASGGTPRRIFRTSEESSEETLEALTIAWQARSTRRRAARGSGG